MRDLINTAQNEILNYPKRSTADKLKNVAKKLLRCGGYVKDPINWPNGLLTVGLMDMFAAELIDEKDTEPVTKLRDKWAKTGFNVRRPEDAIAGHAFFMKGLPEATKIYESLLSAPTDSHGSLLYNPRVKDEILADMIGMAVPLLVDFKNYDMAAKQITNFLDYGFDEKTGLPYHGYKCNSGDSAASGNLGASGAVGILGWGRAVGWILMGEAYFLKYADRKHKDYTRILEAFNSLSTTVLACQRPDGLYGWQLPGQNNHIDTSATAMILGALVMGADAAGIEGVGGAENGAAKVLEAAKKGADGISKYIKDGQIYDGLAECPGPGIHPQVYGAYPWTLGPYLSLMAGLKAEQEM